MNGMRKSFGGWLVNRRASRVGLIAGFLSLGLLGIISAAIVVLIAELKGWREAAVDCLMAFGVLMLFMAVLGVEWAPLAVTGVTAWVAAIALGAMTAAYASLALSLQAILVISIFGIVGFALRNRLERLVDEQDLELEREVLESVGFRRNGPESRQ